MASILTPVVFIHGLWLHANSWDNWVKLFRRFGFTVVAPGWPGEHPDVREARLLVDDVAGFGIEDVTRHYTAIIKQFDTKPIVIGHAFGGLIAQKLLGADMAAAAIAIAPVQFKGVWRLPLRQITAGLPAFANPFNYSRAVELTAYNFRYAFGNALSLDESTELYTTWSIPSPGRPLFEVAFANVTPNSPAVVNVMNGERGPLLLMAAERDNTVPPSVVRAQHKLYQLSPAITEIKEFANRGHSLPIDSGWREVADASLDWLRLHVLSD